MPTPSYLAEINYLNLFLKDGILSQEEFDKLTTAERANLNHELTHHYVQKKIITVERAKSLSKDEFSRLTNYDLVYLFDHKKLPVEEILTLSTRRAVILTSPNVCEMKARFLFSTSKALDLNNTFDFLDLNARLYIDVMHNGVSPEFALQVHTFYINLLFTVRLIEVLKDFNKKKSELYNIQLSLDPRTATQCYALVRMKNEIVKKVREAQRRVLNKAPQDIIDYINIDPKMYHPSSLVIDTQKVLGQSNGYRDYCLKIIQSSFDFLRSSNSNDTPVSPRESEQNRDRRLKTVGLHLHSMWQQAAGSNYPRLRAEEGNCTPSPQ